jgi:glycosyltransferase involved in cell wall biosynthesis
MIVVLLMVKNEEDLIRITLDTVKAFPIIVLYDTGSTDSTLSIVRKEYPFVKVVKGTFVDFSTSRNEMIHQADKIVQQEGAALTAAPKTTPYYLILDAGDEVIVHGSLKVHLSTLETSSAKAYLIPQVWESSTLTRYYNIRLFKACEGFKYHGKVHEYLKSPCPVTERLGWLEIYQDRRRKGCESSNARWKKDLELLLDEVSQEPDNARAWFYLAQTYECLGQLKEALRTYKARSRMLGFYEERFMATLRVANLYQELKGPWEKAFPWYMKAFHLIERVEPLLKVAQYYLSMNQYLTAWRYLNIACNLEYPQDNILFVDKDAYDYQRWHLMGITAWYCNKFRQGKKACERAIKQKNLTVDKNNLRFYVA